MSFHAVPTVRVVSPVSAENPSGYIVINQVDFDHRKHEPWHEPATAAVQPGEGDAAAGDQADAADGSGASATQASGAAPAAKPGRRKAGA